MEKDINTNDSVDKEERSYIAFISYRHRELDKKAAMMIQKRIENYRVPKELQEQAGGSRLGHVFRDEDELPISSSLSNSIIEALDHTKFLIVICTPDLPKSQWCEQEIKYFLKTHDRDHLLAVLADGTPEVSFSPWMLHEFDEEGNITADLEPLAANIAGDDHKLSRKVFNKESMRILAALIGCPFDTLWQRDRRARTNRLMAGMSVVAAALAVFAGVVLSKNAEISAQNEMITAQNEEISAQNAEITEHNRNLMKQASSLHVDAGYSALDKFDRKTALKEAGAAIENEDPDIYDHRVTGLYSDALALYTEKTLTTTAVATQPMPIRYMEVTKDASSCVTLDESGYLRRIDLVSGETLWEISGSGEDGSSYSAGRLFLAEEQGIVIVSARYYTFAFSLEDGSRLWKFEPEEGGSEFFAMTETGQKVAVLDGTNRQDANPDVVILDLVSGAVKGRVTPGDGQSFIQDSFLSFGSSYGADFTEDGKSLLVGFAEGFPEKDEEGKSGNYRYYVIDAGTVSVKQEYTGAKFENSATIYFGLTLNEETGELFCSHFSQYAGYIRNAVCNPQDSSVTYETIDHMEKGTNGTLLSVSTKVESEFLTSDHLVVVGTQSTLFVFDKGDGKLRKGIEMTGEILRAEWYDRDEEILLVTLSDGNFAFYDLEHEANVFYNGASSIDMELPSIKAAYNYRNGPALNSKEGLWITVPEDMAGTILVTKAETDPQITELEGKEQDTDIRDVVVLNSPSGNTTFVLYRDDAYNLILTAHDPDTLEMTGQTLVEEEFSSLSAAAIDDTHVIVGCRIICTDGSWEYIEGVTEDDYYAEFAGNVTRNDGTVLTYAYYDSYDGYYVRLWENGKAAGADGSPDVLAMTESWGADTGENGLATAYGSLEQGEMEFISFDSKSGKVYEIKDLHPDHTTMTLATGISEPVFACADKNGIITAYNAETGEGADLSVQYAVNQISAISYAGNKDQYLVIITTDERLDIVDLETNEIVFSEILADVVVEQYKGGDRELICSENEETGELFITVSTGSVTYCGYLLVVDTRAFCERNLVNRIFAVDNDNSRVFRVSKMNVYAFPWRTLEELKALAGK